MALCMVGVAADPDLWWVSVGEETRGKGLDGAEEEGSVSVFLSSIPRTRCGACSVWRGCDLTNAVCRAVCSGLVDVMLKFVVQLANKSHLRW